jgi:hypothetical protein
MKQNFEERLKRTKRLFLILYIITIIGFFILGSLSIYYSSLYHYAIEYGADSTITALEMVTACQQLSNVTSEQIERRYTNERRN